MAGDELTREAEQRLGAALERIADMAHGLARTPEAPSASSWSGGSPCGGASSGSAPDAAEIVARLDVLIERLRAALDQPAH